MEDTRTNTALARPPGCRGLLELAQPATPRRQVLRRTASNCREKPSMRDLNYSLKQLCHRNQDGSYATRADRERMLNLFAEQLEGAGFRHLQADRLKPKHVEALLTRWQSEGLSTGTVKNRMAVLRWWAEKIGKPALVARSNESYSIPDRQYVTNVSKARELTHAELAKVSDRHVATSLQLQAAFGLRREESIKIQPGWADRGDHLRLKASWTKGGKERAVPIRTQAQRDVLDAAKGLAPKGSLIPAGLNYKGQLNRFKYQCARAGIHDVHGHRHAYAQARYRELTGRPCPARGGPTAKQLTAEEKALDRDARLTISKELGHEREAITAAYLGR